MDTLIPLGRLNSIGFVWDEKEHNWKDAVKSFKEKEGGGRDVKGRGQARGGVGRWQTSAEGLGRVDGHQKTAKSNGKLDSTPGREVERDWLSISQ